MNITTVEIDENHKPKYPGLAYPDGTRYKSVGTVVKSSSPVSPDALPKTPQFATEPNAPAFQETESTPKALVAVVFEFGEHSVRSEFNSVVTSLHDTYLVFDLTDSRSMFLPFFSSLGKTPVTTPSIIMALPEGHDYAYSLDITTHPPIALVLPGRKLYLVPIATKQEIDPHTRQSFDEFFGSTKKPIISTPTEVVSNGEARSYQPVDTSRSSFEPDGEPVEIDLPAEVYEGGDYPTVGDLLRGKSSS